MTMLMVENMAANPGWWLEPINILIGENSCRIAFSRACP